jgi:CspA family cold shock protein
MDSTVSVDEVLEQNVVGDVIGQCKWFSDKLGYGFVTVQSGSDKGKDIFVHHSGIKPLNSNYKTLRKGEYINFNIINGENGLQAVNITGIGGGTLMCDIIPTRAPSVSQVPIMQQYPMDQGIAYTNVQYKKPQGARPPRNALYPSQRYPSHPPPPPPM